MFLEGCEGTELQCRAGGQEPLRTVGLELGSSRSGDSLFLGSLARPYECESLMS